MIKGHVGRSINRQVREAHCRRTRRLPRRYRVHAGRIHTCNANAIPGIRANMPRRCREECRKGRRSNRHRQVKQRSHLSHKQTPHTLPSSVMLTCAWLHFMTPSRGRMRACLTVSFFFFFSLFFSFFLSSPKQRRPRGRQQRRAGDQV